MLLMTMIAIPSNIPPTAIPTHKPTLAMFLLWSVGVVLGSGMEVGLLVKSMVESVEVGEGSNGVGMGCRTWAVGNHEKYKYGIIYMYIVLF